MTPIRTIIVDDEPLARDGIQALLRNDPEIEIIGECATGHGVVKAIQEGMPDLIFLDIQMPGMDGFSALEAIGTDHLPHVIFVTAFDNYALRAFDFYALDYILKPFDRERFERAVRRAKIQIKYERSEAFNERVLTLLEDLRAPSTYLQRIVIKTDGRVFFLKVEHLEWIEAEGNYVRLHSRKDSHLLRETISNLEAQLDPKKFLRIHRSAIVNIEYIQELQPLFHGDYRVILRDGTHLTLSRNYRKAAESPGCAIWG